MRTYQPVSVRQEWTRRTPDLSARVDETWTESAAMSHGLKRCRHRLHDTTGGNLGPSSIAFTCKGRTRQLQVRPMESLLYGPCRYGTRTSQPPVRRSGCGPCSPENVVEM